MEAKKGLNKLILMLETIPGIVGLTPIVDNYDVKQKSKNNSILLIENGKKVELSIGIIIKKDIVVKNLINEINEHVSYILNKEKKCKLNKLNVYIKGIK